MTKPRPRREDRQPGETFRDAVGSYLCSYGLRILKDRHKAEHEPLTGTPAEVEMPPLPGKPRKERYGVLEPIKPFAD